VETITFTATDPSLASDSDAATFTVTAVNDAPVVADIPNQTITEGGSFTTINLDNYVSDVDNPDTAMTWTYSGNTELAVSIVNRVATVTAPSADWFGVETITFTATDPSLASDSDAATFTVTAVNDPPVAAADGTYAATEDTALVVPLGTGVLANDTDPDNLAAPYNAGLTAVKVTDPANGTLTLNANGSFTYTPNANYYGPDSFTYYATDGALNSATVTATINVAGVADPPVAAADGTYAATEDTALVVPLGTGVLANDTDPDNLTPPYNAGLTAVKVTDPGHGTLTLNANGSFTYTPNANYYGPDSFTYYATDGALNSATVTATINVAAVNDAPVALADAYTTPEDTPLFVTLPAQGVLANDTDIELNPLTVFGGGSIDTPHGTAILAADGTFTYVPDANYNGIDAFQYKATDGSSQSDFATVTITVTPTNDLPNAVNDAPSLPEDSVGLNLNVLANDSFGGDGPAAIPLAITVAPSHGAAVVDEGGTLNNPIDDRILYTPTPDYFGPDSLTYQICDLGIPATPQVQNCVTAVVSINVTGVNDLPTAVAESYTLNLLTKKSGTTQTLEVPAPGLLANDLDPDLTGLEVIPKDNESTSFGSITLHADGSFSYTADDLYDGQPDTFTYQVKESGGTDTSAEVTVTIMVDLVKPVNDDSEARPLWVDPPAKVIRPYQQFSTGTISLVASLASLPVEDYYVAFLRFNYAEDVENRGWILIGTDDTPELVDGKYLFSTDLNIDDLLLDGQGEYPEGVIGPGINEDGENELIVRVYDLHGNFVGNYDPALPQQNRLIIQRIPVFNSYLYLPMIHK
jgi:VCBS repeat-containing protein